MKFNKMLSGFAFMAILGATLSSCSSELNEPTLKESNMLVKAPKVVAYSGSHYWNQYGSTLTTRSGEGVVSASKIKEVFNETDVNDLYNKTNEYLQEGNSNTDRIDTDFLYYADEDITFNLYCLMKNTNQDHYLGVFYYDENGERHEINVWESINPNFYDKSYDWDYEKNEQVTHQNLEGVEISIKAGYKFGFYWNGICRPHEGSYTDENCVYYSISELNEPQKDADSDEVYSSHAGTFEIDGKTIIGLEDWYDFDYQDLVFFTDVVLKKVPSTDILPDNDQPQHCPNPDCNHPVHGEGHCNECGDNEGCNKKDEPTTPGIPDVKIPDNLDPGFNVNPDQPETPAPGVAQGKNEVEINLGLDEKEGRDELSSHLSIHVRAATDVDVFIPVPAQYYCEADDMAIVMQHEANHMAHGGPFEFTYVLKDSELSVSLFVEYVENGIHIWTDGITQEVIDWCYEKCQDGITFEVWNYFNDPEKTADLPNGPISIDELKYLLNQATVKFLDEVPDSYINSFGTENGKYDANDPSSHGNNDFHVTLVEQADQFEEPVEGPHLNGSNNNEIYNNKNVK